jgi:hypothetical protein
MGIASVGQVIVLQAYFFYPDRIPDHDCMKKGERFGFIFSQAFR